MVKYGLPKYSTVLKSCHRGRKQITKTTNVKPQRDLGKICHKAFLENTHQCSWRLCIQAKLKQLHQLKKKRNNCTS
jgi:hypothetical protein